MPCRSYEILHSPALVPLATRSGGQGGLCQCCPRAVVEDGLDLLVFSLVSVRWHSRALWGRTRGAVKHTSSVWRREKTSLTTPSPFCSLLRNRRRAPTPPLRMKTLKVPVGALGRAGKLFRRGALGSLVWPPLMRYWLWGIPSPSSCPGALQKLLELLR